MKRKSTPLFLFPPPLAGLAGGGGLWLVFSIYAIIKLATLNKGTQAVV